MTPKKNRAYIIGNGLTRKGFELQDLKDETTFGCNAIFREFSPSYVIAIDDGPIDELHSQTQYPQHRILVPPMDERWESIEYNPQSRARSNAGMNCMVEAIRRGFNDLYCLGFDFLIDDMEIAQGNMFDGTKHYGKETRATYEDNKNRVKYLQWFVNKNYDITFTFLFPRQELEVYDIVGPNVKGMYYDQL